MNSRAKTANAGVRRKPDFIGVGVQRSGTTFLQYCLQEHPQIGKPLRGLHFFSHDANYNEEIQQVAVNDVNWYEQQFGQYRDKTVVGEFSVTYSFPQYITEVSAKIQEYYPDIKIIIALRNPIERMISEFRRLQERSEISTRLSLDQFINDYPAIVDRGRYGQILNIYLSCFSKEQIHIKIFEDLLYDRRKEYVTSLYEFLNIDPSFWPDGVDNNPNPSRPKKQTLVGKLVTLTQRNGTQLMQSRLKFLVNWVRTTYLWKQVREWNTASTDVTPESRKRLSDIYQYDIKQVEIVMNRDLSFWK